MKRLVMLFIAAMTVTTFAQSKNLSGSWAFDTEKSGGQNGPQTMAITLTAKQFSLQMGGPKGETITFNLDGTETTLDHGMKGRAEWKGAKLYATVGSDTVAFFREGDWLVQEQATKSGPVKLYFKKAPAK